MSRNDASMTKITETKQRVVVNYRFHCIKLNNLHLISLNVHIFQASCPVKVHYLSQNCCHHAIQVAHSVWTSPKFLFFYFQCLFTKLFGWIVLTHLCPKIKNYFHRIHINVMHIYGFTTCKIYKAYTLSVIKCKI